MALKTFVPAARGVGNWHGVTVTPRLLIEREGQAQDQAQQSGDEATKVIMFGVGL
jgi:hypothetical protein